MACDHRPRAELRRRPILRLALGAALLAGLACGGGGGTPNIAAPRLTGTVRDVAGKPVSGVTLRLTQEGAVAAETTSAADGSFTIEPRPGEYVLTPSATEADAVFSPEASRVSLDWNTAPTVNFLRASLTFQRIPLHDIVGVEDLTLGGDGALWLAEETAGMLSRLASDGAYLRLATPSGPFAVTTDVNGRVWFTTLGGGNLHLGYVNDDGQSLTTLTILDAAANPTNVVPGPGGEIWVMENGIGKVARVVPGTDSALTTKLYDMPAGSWGWPYDLALAPDGTVWYTDTVKPQIGKITPGQGITTFPTTAGATGGATGIVAAAGAIWFSSHDLNAIVRMGMDGAVTGTFPLPTADAGPERIVVGKDGALWFPELGARKIGRLTTDGAIAEFAIPNASKLRSITPDPDGGVWFSDHEVNRIGHLR